MRECTEKMPRSYFKQRKGGKGDHHRNSDWREKGWAWNYGHKTLFWHVDDGCGYWKRETREGMRKALLGGWFQSLQDKTLIWFKVPYWGLSLAAMMCCNKILWSLNKSCTVSLNAMWISVSQGIKVVSILKLRSLKTFFNKPMKSVSRKECCSQFLCVGQPYPCPWKKLWQQ